ncbi:MAG TPA: hypothetical protein VH559_01170 [Gemmatimonadaceae bacterium]|jgi:hypothetical protein
MISNVRRVCAKLYADRALALKDDVFVALFHEWIQKRSLPGVLLDVADYMHVPDGPGIILVGYATTFALDRGDGRFGLLAQRRRPDRDARSAIASAVRELLEVATRLEADKRLEGALVFDRSVVRVEVNDRLHAQNSDASFEALAPIAREVIAEVLGRSAVAVERVENDLRDRLALIARLA